MDRPFRRKKEKRSTQTGCVLGNMFQTVCSSGGYTPLNKNPEVAAGCRVIADLISSMTIYLMANTEKGDVRIKNNLSRHIDVTPNRYMTRKTWMDAIVMNMLLYGKGNSVVLPETNNGLLGDMHPIPPGRVSFLQDGFGYKVSIDGVEKDPGDILHFVYNPHPDYPWRGQGVTIYLKDLVRNLAQAQETENAFMESKYMPPVIVKVDGLTDEFASKGGRKKLLEDYIETSEKGEPWVIPADTMEISQIKPLTLADIAIKDTVELSKKTVAAILGVPAFVLGVGTYTDKEWNNFVNSKIRSITQIIEQELTRKLLTSEKMYCKLNSRSLYDFDLVKLAAVYSELKASGTVSGNEVRDIVGLDPREDLDEIVILENYLPANRLGDQKKLKDGDE